MYTWNRMLSGEVAEWLKALLSKSSILSKTGSWVRIPPSPPGGPIHRPLNRLNCNIANFRVNKLAGKAFFSI